MKKVIAGNLYDTDTATAIGELFNGLSGIDSCLEELYKKRTGEFFSLWRWRR